MGVGAHGGSHCCRRRRLGDARGGEEGTKGPRSGGGAALFSFHYGCEIQGGKNPTLRDKSAT